jgi:hypothetical protein
MSCEITAIVTGEAHLCTKLGTDDGMNSFKTILGFYRLILTFKTSKPQNLESWWPLLPPAQTVVTHQSTQLSSIISVASFSNQQSNAVHRSTRNPRETPIYEAHDNKETGRLRLRPLQEEQDEVRRFEALQKVHPFWKGTVVCPAAQNFEARPELLQRVFPRYVPLELRFFPF